MRSSLALLMVLSASPAAAQTWVVQPAQSQVGFTGKMTGTAFNGTFEKYATSIQFDPANWKAAKIGVVIDMRTARTGDKQKDEALPEKEWFDAKAHPTATFRVKRVTATGPNAYSADSTLTMKGITRPMVLPFTLAIQNDIAKIAGTVTIDRRQFNIGTGQWLSDQWVAYPVVINVSLTAQKTP